MCSTKIMGHFSLIADGDYAEFGCCGGWTFALAYYESVRHAYKVKLWAFDSFQGLPAPEGVKDEHPRWTKGNMLFTLDQFYAHCDSKKIPRNIYTVVPGFYDQTLITGNSVNLPNNISLVYIDCDLYSSTKDEFIKKAVLAHGNEYDYSLVNYIKNNGNVIIICKKHGQFSQLRSHHLNGSGCPKCASEKRTLTTENFIEKAIKKHGNKYDYSETNYRGYYKPTTIICPIHVMIENK